MAKKNIKSETPKKKRPISLNILEIAKRLQKVEEIAGEPYTLPTASDSTKGGVKIGSGLTMTGEVLSTDAVIAADVSYSNSDSGLTATNVQGAVDEMAESYPADNVIMSDGVTSVGERVEACDIDNDFIDISSYIYDNGTFNDYTAPSDGYVVFNFTASQDGGIFLKTDTNSHVTAATTKELRQFIYVKKGMQFCFGSTPTVGRFYRLYKRRLT